MELAERGAFPHRLHVPALATTPVVAVAAVAVRWAGLRGKREAGRRWSRCRQLHSDGRISRSLVVGRACVFVFVFVFVPLLGVGWLDCSVRCDCSCSVSGSGSTST